MPWYPRFPWLQACLKFGNFNTSFVREYVVVSCQFWRDSPLSQRHMSKRSHEIYTERSLALVYWKQSCHDVNLSSLVALEVAVDTMAIFVFVICFVWMNMLNGAILPWVNSSGLGDSTIIPNRKLSQCQRSNANGHGKKLFTHIATQGTAKLKQCANLWKP